MTAQQTDLRVWYDGSNNVIASDREDARACLFEHIGGDIEDYADTDVTTIDDGFVIGIWCDAKGDPDEPDGDGNDRIEKTAAEWAKRGRGFLCSEDF